jgi:iron(III) transport system substrate-binding protein
LKKLARFGLVALPLLALLLTLVSPGRMTPASAQAAPADPPDLKALVDAVNKEGGDLNLSWSNAVYGGADGAKKIQDAINAQYHTHLNIRFTPLAIPGFAFTSQLQQEVAAGQTASSDIAFDLHLTSEAPAYLEVDYRKYVRGLPEEAMFYNKRALILGTYLGGFYYNTNLVKGAMVPHSIYDLLKPEWKGKIATPQIEGSQSIFLALPDGIGEAAYVKYFQQFAKQVGGLIRCGTSDRVASGEFAIFGYDCGDNEARLAQRKGQPLEEFYPKEGTGLGYFVPAIPKTSAHPMAARLWMAYMISKPGQELLWQLMAIDNDKLPGSHMAQLIADQKKAGVKIIVFYGLDATHPDLAKLEAQISDIVANASAH